MTTSGASIPQPQPAACTFLAFLQCLSGPLLLPLGSGVHGLRAVLRRVSWECSGTVWVLCVLVSRGCRSK